MKLLLTLLVSIGVAYATDSCPAFQPWKEWTSDCLWLPYDDIRNKAIEACDITVPEAFKVSLPNIEGMPDKCGHCSFKFRCQKRAPTDTCFPINTEHQTCHEFGDVCNMPKLTWHDLGCKWNLASMVFKQCHNRDGMSDEYREHLAGMSKNMPKFHCTEKEGQCKCCCHPHAPNAAGDECTEHTEPECQEFGEYNDWNDKCVWFPPDQLRKDFQDHCGMAYKPSKHAEKAMKKFKLPDGLKIPEQCGMCSFKFKCKKRDAKSAAGKKECFPLQVMKKPCTNEDMPGAGDVCTLPKIFNSCNYTEQIKKLLGPLVRSKMNKMPLSMKHDFLEMIANLPHGRCIEKDGKCKCCCHPYQPSEDGTRCVLARMCNFPSDFDDFDFKLEDTDSWFLF